MKNIKNYNSFVNEDIRQYLKPKSKEEIERIISKYREGGTVHVFKDVIGKILSSIIPTKKEKRE